MESLFTDQEIKAADMAAETNAGHTFWKPVIDGDAIEGLYLGSRTRKNDYGEQTVATIDARLCESEGLALDAGKYDIGFTTVLEDRFRDAKPIAGRTLVRIVYRGKATSKKGTSYKVFVVYAKPAPKELVIPGLADAKPAADPVHGEFEDDVPF